MSSFRLVVLDYAKEQLDNPVAQEIFSDVLFVKQKNFLRTDPNFVVMDKHDMIGTHYLIYDTTNLMRPKLVLAIRTTFAKRAKDHGLETPLMALLPRMEKKLQNKFKEFNQEHPELVDCNAWFVDVGYSKKNSGLALSDIAYFLVCMNIMRMGYDNFIGCSNETYNASRWLENVGVMEKGLMFEHPSVKAPHMMVLLSQFNLKHFEQVYHQYQSLIQETFEVLPEQVKVPSIAEYAVQLFAANGQATKVAGLKAA